MLDELRLRRRLRYDGTAGSDDRIDVDIEIWFEESICDRTPILEQPSETLICLLPVDVVNEIRRTSYDHVTLGFLSVC